MLRFSQFAAARRGIALAATSLLALSVVPAAGAADVPIYQAIVPMKGTGEAARSAAFAEALRVVAVRASGRRAAAENPTVSAAAGDAARYVQQYAATADRRLKVGFDTGTLEQLLLQAGLPLWPAERPTTLVLLGGEPAAVRAEIERVAQLRGLPLRFSTAGVDPAALAAAASRGDARAVLGLAGGAASDAVVITSMGSGSWYCAHGAEVELLQGSASDVMHAVADLQAARYAPASTRGIATAEISVGGIDRLAAYTAVLDYLGSLSTVRNVAVRGLHGSTLQLQLTMRGDLELLRRLAALDGRLQSAPALAGAAAPGVTFIYPP